MRRAGHPGKTKTAALLVVIALGAGLLAGIAGIPILAVTGIATRNAARAFNALPVAGLGQLPARSELLDSRGHLIAYYYPRNIYRVPVRYSAIAPVMRHAIIAIEDERFYQHGALDVRGTIRALTTTLSGSGTQGGSDIAQQYVKNACILAAQSPRQAARCSAVTVARKLTELRVAANVMRRMTRHQLLAAYLNAAYFNNQAYGVQVAAQFYFSTPAKSLTLTQAAMLAGLVQNPAAFDPLQHPLAALSRRNVVLQRMARLHDISFARAALAESQPLGLHTSPLPLQTGCLSDAARRAAFFCQGLDGAERDRRHEDPHDDGPARSARGHPRRQLRRAGELRLLQPWPQRERGGADPAGHGLHQGHRHQPHVRHRAWPHDRQLRGEHQVRRERGRPDRLVIEGVHPRDGHEGGTAVRLPPEGQVPHDGRALRQLPRRLRPAVQGHQRRRSAGGADLHHL